MTASKTAGRPIGVKVKSSVEALERLGGWQRAPTVAQTMPGESTAATLKYLRRGVRYGLLDGRGVPHIEFQPVDNWRELLVRAPDPKDVFIEGAPIRKVDTSQWKRPVSFVFNLGSINT